jgi:hypothetical protein
MIAEAVAHFIDNCGHSDCKSRCGNCLEIETYTHPIESLPRLLNLQAEDIPGESSQSVIQVQVQQRLWNAQNKHQFRVLESYMMHKRSDSDSDGGNAMSCSEETVQALI